MQLFYDPSLDPDSNQFDFSSQESGHIVRVLRKTQGDRVHITNGRGSLFEAEILLADPRRTKAKIVAQTQSRPRGFSLHLAVAPTKMNERFEWLLEKATEIGLDQISPILCDRSERKTIKGERLERVLQSAMKQSLRTHLPKLHPLQSLKDFLDEEHPGLKFIAHCDEGDKMDLKRVAQPDRDITVLIGPEGDFSKEEIALARAKGFVPVSLGDHRLRTETAALLACAIINTVNN